MIEVFSRARDFILLNARLLERTLFQTHFGVAAPGAVGAVIRAYQNSDGGLGHALEPDIRCSESQPLFVAEGLAALYEAGCHDHELALSFCTFLESVSDARGLVPILLPTALSSAHASHWRQLAPPDLNPTAGICGLLHYQGVEHPWLSRATQTCSDLLLSNPPLEAHTLGGATRLVDHLPDRDVAQHLFDRIADVIPRSRFFISTAPVREYGLTPLHFSPSPLSSWRRLFSAETIEGHLQDLLARQQADGGWPISWEAPGPGALLEWRGRGTIEALSILVAYGCISVPQQ